MSKTRTITLTNRPPVKISEDAWPEQRGETMTYTYTIFDADPQSSSGCAWHDHQDIEIEADSDEDAIDAACDVMSVVAAGLSPSDGYDVGQRLYALVWDVDGTIVGTPTYEITPKDTHP